MDIASSLMLEIVEADSREVGVNWNFREFNQFAKLYYIGTGEGKIDISGKQVNLLPGCLYYIPPYMPLVLSCDESMFHYWVHFRTGSLLGGLLSDLIGEDYCAELSDGDMSDIVGYFNYLMHNCDSAKVRDRMFCQGYLRVLLSYMLPDSDKSASGLAEFRDTLEYIEKNLHKPLDNQTLAKLHNWHPTYFANRFSRELGMSPRSYIIRRRIEEARKLLWSGEYSVEQAGEAVGFSDGFYFSKVFSKLTGISPGRYRRQARDESC